MRAHCYVVEGWTEKYDCNPRLGGIGFQVIINFRGSLGIDSYFK
jgi:hypothetical protein